MLFLDSALFLDLSDREDSTRCYEVRKQRKSEGVKLEAAVELVEKCAEPRAFSILPVFNGRLFKQLAEREPKSLYDRY